jgi:hypothetical protein
MSSERKLRVGGQALLESVQQTWHGHLPAGFTKWLEDQTYVVRRGAPKKVASEKACKELYVLASAMDEIRREKFNGKWSATAVANYFKHNHPDRVLYRHVKLGALIKRVERLAKQIGPMDDDAMCRARALLGEPDTQDS